NVWLRSFPSARSHHEPAFYECPLRFAKTILGSLRRDPLDQLLQAVFQAPAWTVFKQFLGLADVGETVTDIPTSRSPEDLGLEFRLPHRLSQKPRHLEDAMAASAADIDRLAGRCRHFHGQPKGPRDIRDVNEVAPLLTILKDRRGLVVEKTPAEDGEHARVGIGELLSGAEDVEEPQRHS